MSYNYYIRFKKEELILRDYLAADRTVLANERTFMSYIRTTVALAGAGGTIIHFLDSLAATIGGIALIILGAFFLIWGVQRYFYYRKHLHNLQISQWHEQVQLINPGEGI